MSLTNQGTGAAQAAPVPANPKSLWRCESCSGLVIHQDILEGGCAQCGGRRIRLAVCVNSNEIKALEERGYEFDPELWSDTPTLNKKP